MKRFDTGGLSGGHEDIPRKRQGYGFGGRAPLEITAQESGLAVEAAVMQ